jgi:HD-GYP domain-containing protein (c-di-GMP phosphodiesterase class II)
MVRMSDLARGGGEPTPSRKTDAPVSTETARGTVAAPPPPAPPPSAPSPRPPAPRSRMSSLYTQVRTSEGPVPSVPAVLPTAPDATDSAEQILDDLRGFLERVPEFLKSSEPLPWGPLERIVDRVVRSLEASGDLFWLANNPIIPKRFDYLSFHQSRVTVLAIRIGMTIGFEHRRLVELGVAAALSGLGLWQLPAGVLRRLDALSPEGEVQYHAAPRVAAERLRRWGAPYEGLVDTVLQHHEREQGQGFPQGIQGPAIRIEAKIVGLADTYMALTAPPSLRPGLRPHEAVREIVRSKHEAFPSVLVKALLSDVTVFPPGTVVRLNTGEIGSVIAVNRNHPLRPRVEIVDGKTGPLATPKIVDLSEAPFLYITGPVSEPAR